MAVGDPYAPARGQPSGSTIAPATDLSQVGLGAIPNPSQVNPWQLPALASTAGGGLAYPTFGEAAGLGAPVGPSTAAAATPAVAPAPAPAVAPIFTTGPGRGAQVPTYSGTAAAPSPGAAADGGFGSNAGTAYGGLVNLGPTASTLSHAAGFLPGPLGPLASLGVMGARGYNTMTANATLGELGLPHLSALQDLGAVTGFNNYGALDGTGNLAAANAQGYANDAHGALAGTYKGDMLGQIAASGNTPAPAAAATTAQSTASPAATPGFDGATSSTSANSAPGASNPGQADASTGAAHDGTQAGAADASTGAAHAGTEAGAADASTGAAHSSSDGGGDSGQTGGGQGASSSGAASGADGGQGAGGGEGGQGGGDGGAAGNGGQGGGSSHAGGGFIAPQDVHGASPPPDQGYTSVRPGEYIVNASMAQKYAPILAAINSGTYDPANPPGNPGDNGMSGIGGGAPFGASQQDPSAGGQPDNDQDDDDQAPLLAGPQDPANTSPLMPFPNSMALTPDAAMQRLTTLPTDQRMALAQVVADPTIQGALSMVLGPPFAQFLQAAQSAPVVGPGAGGAGGSAGDPGSMAQAAPPPGGDTGGGQQSGAPGGGVSPGPSGPMPGPGSGFGAPPPPAPPGPMPHAGGGPVHRQDVRYGPPPVQGAAPPGVRPQKTGLGGVGGMQRPPAAAGYR